MTNVLSCEYWVSGKSKDIHISTSLSSGKSKDIHISTSLSSGEECTCQCRGHKLYSWSGTIPHAAEQLSPCATTTEPTHGYYWSPCSLTREAPQWEACTPQRGKNWHAAIKTKCSQKQISNFYFFEKRYLCQMDIYSKALKPCEACRLSLSIPNCCMDHLRAQGYMRSSAFWVFHSTESENYISIQVFYAPGVLYVQQRKIIFAR